MPNKRPSVKNEKQYEGLKKKGMSKSRAARMKLARRVQAWWEEVRVRLRSKNTASQSGTTQQKKSAGRKGGKAAARKR